MKRRHVTANGIETHSSRAERTRQKLVQKKERAESKEQARIRADADKAERIKIKRAQSAEAERRKAIERMELARAREEDIKRRQEVNRVRSAARRKVYAKIRKALGNRSSGFDYVNYGFMPRVELSVIGDGASVASKFCAAGIDVREAVRKDGITTLKIRKKDLRKAIAILNDLCYNFSVGKSFGVGRTAAFVLARAGLAVGTGLAVLFLTLSYGYVWRVNISGNERLTTAAISSALTASGIKSGLRKSELDCERVSAIVNGIDGVSDASCEIVGTTLCVYVLESKEFVEHISYGAYYSEYDATVTRIVARSGSPTVKRGDVVKAGDLLVDGQLLSTTGEPLMVVDCDADVYGEIAVTFNAEFGGTAIEYRRTGNSAQKTGMRLFGHELFEISAPFESYESESYTANYDVLIPLYVTHHRFYETVPVEVAVDPDEAAQEFAAQKIEEIGFIGQFESSFTVSRSVSGLYSVHLFLSGEALISRGGDRPLYDESIPQD